MEGKERIREDVSRKGKGEEGRGEEDRGKEREGSGRSRGTPVYTFKFSLEHPMPDGRG